MRERSRLEAGVYLSQAAHEECPVDGLTIHVNDARAKALHIEQIGLDRETARG